MITFNDKQLPEWVSVTGISFQSLNLSIVEHEVKRRVGNIDAGVEKGGITIDLDVFIEPRKDLTIHDQADQLKAFMMGDKWNVSRLILNEQPNKFYHARVSNAGEITDNFTHGNTTISFYCADPKKYDVNETTLNSTNGQLKINYTGLEKSPVTIEITITNPVTNLELRHTESGKKATILGNFTAGQKVLVDTDNRNIKLNGTSIKDKMAFESSWLFLELGTNTFTCTNANNITNEFKVKYRKVD